MRWEHTECQRRGEQDTWGSYVARCSRSTQPRDNTITQIKFNNFVCAILYTIQEMFYTHVTRDEILNKITHTKPCYHLLKKISDF